jgi:hypothetical protein
MLYLTDKYDPGRKISYAPGSPEYVEELSWLMFQMGGVGPMMGTPNAQSFYITYPLVYLAADGISIKARPSTSESLPARAPTTASSDISMRLSASTQSSTPGSRKARTWPVLSIPLPTLRTIRGFRSARLP